MVKAVSHFCGVHSNEKKKFWVCKKLMTINVAVAFNYKSACVINLLHILSDRFKTILAKFKTKKAKQKKKQNKTNIYI